MCEKKIDGVGHDWTDIDVYLFGVKCTGIFITDYQEKSKDLHPITLEELDGE